MLCQLVTACGGTWILEQPWGSLMEFHPAWRKLCLHLFQVDGVGAAAASALTPKHTPQKYTGKSFNYITCALDVGALSYKCSGQQSGLVHGGLLCKVFEASICIFE